MNMEGPAVPRMTNQPGCKLFSSLPESASEPNGQSWSTLQAHNAPKILTEVQITPFYSKLLCGVRMLLHSVSEPPARGDPCSFARPLRPRRKLIVHLQAHCTRRSAGSRDGFPCYKSVQKPKSIILARCRYWFGRFVWALYIYDLSTSSHRCVQDACLCCINSLLQATGVWIA